MLKGIKLANKYLHTISVFSSLLASSIYTYSITYFLLAYYFFLTYLLLSSYLSLCYLLETTKYLLYMELTCYGFR